MMSVDVKVLFFFGRGGGRGGGQEPRNQRGKHF